MRPYTVGILLFSLFFSLASCSNVATILKERELRVDLDYAENLFAEGKYEAALSEFERLDKRHPQSPFSDKIIFHIGLLYLHHNNLKRDVNKGINILEGFIKKYPNSKYVLYARPYVFYSKEGIEQKTEIERLKGEMEKFKDIQIQLQKREKELKK